MIKTALISVSNKAGLVNFASFLAEMNVRIISTGKTADELRKAKIAVLEAAEYTGFPEIMDGRVKTLHPKIHGGILAVRDKPEHLQALKTHNIETIDLVVIDLYPFEETVRKGGAYSQCIEQIDIGGPSMIRSAAKNHQAVTVITNPADYELVMSEMSAGGGATTLATRQKLAAQAFAHTAAYDAAISSWFAGELGDKLPERYVLSGKRVETLNYGENPHQKAAFYASSSYGRFSEENSLSSARQIQGKNLSYNNLNDASAGLELVREFSSPAVAIIKHANPCGVATGDNISDCFARALACDPTSAYGGIIAVNREIDAQFANALGNLFVEVIIAPEANEEAIAIFSTRKKLKLLLSGKMSPPQQTRLMIKSISGGFLVQEDDNIITSAAPRIVTKTPIEEATMNDLQLAFTVAKHVKSNAIVMVKNQATIGIGAGQMSRIDAARIASMKAAAAGLSTKGAALASDAFFPFADSVELAAEAGISAIIQPGGSIRDEEVIEAADKYKIGMAFTAIRHFRH